MRHAAAGHRARRGGASGEEGITLIELLVAVMMLGLAAVGIMAGIGTSFRVAEYHRKASTAETVLRAYTEVLKEPKKVPYIACSPTAVLQPITPFTGPPDTYSEYLQEQVYNELETGQTRYRVEITKVEIMIGNGVTTGPKWGLCGGSNTDKGAQRITLVVRAASGAGQAVERVTIVKRDGTQDIAPTTSTTIPSSTSSTTTPGP